MFEETYRRMNDRLAPPERLVQATLQAVRPKRSFSVCRAAAVALAFVLCLMITTSALAATVPEFNSWLYTIAPDIALYFRPVRMADENNGVRMEVEAIRISGREAQIYVTVTDLEGGRLDDTVDLFDSYDLDVPANVEATCTLMRFDPELCSATFLIRYISPKEISREKLTFRIHRILTHKTNGTVHVYPYDYGPFDGETEAVEQGTRVFGGVTSEEYIEEHGLAYEPFTREKYDECMRLLKQEPVMQPGRINVALNENVQLTGVGYVNGMLHIQLHYNSNVVEDTVFDLDSSVRDHVYTYSSVCFRDEEHSGYYHEYIFKIAPDELQSMRMISRYVMAETEIRGPWSVTFPIMEIP